MTKAGSAVTATVVDDLRAIGYGSGSYLINSTMVMDYMSSPGYRFRMPDGAEWLIGLDGSRIQTAVPASTASGAIGAFADGWNADAPGTSYLLRDGRRRSMFLELRRQGATVAVSASGHVADQTVRVLSAGDRPAFPVIATGLYKNGADFGCTLSIDSDNGNVRLNAGTPGVDIPYTPPGDWSLRVYAEWYTA